MPNPHSETPRKRPQQAIHDDGRQSINYRACLGLSIASRGITPALFPILSAHLLGPVAVQLPRSLIPIEDGLSTASRSVPPPLVPRPSPPSRGVRPALRRSRCLPLYHCFVSHGTALCAEPRLSAAYRDGSTGPRRGGREMGDGSASLRPPPRDLSQLSAADACRPSGRAPRDRLDGSPS